ncbi:MAG: methyl-accepting chemotaxis protein [Malikia sp.]|nr:methyl-accepting chemotaxis protein [Malikia sp.]
MSKPGSGPTASPPVDASGLAGLQLAGPVLVSSLLALGLVGALVALLGFAEVPWRWVLSIALLTELLLLGGLWGFSVLQPRLRRFPWLVMERRLPVARAATEVRDAGPYLELLTSQLQGALQDAEKDVTAIVESLNRMNEVSQEELARIEASKHNGAELLEVVHEKMQLDQQLGMILEMFVQKLQQDVADNLGRVQRLQEVKALEPMVDVIATVARQINFLSINAAVEAARAGHSGNGFAVVAAEIRSLSTKTAATVKDISARIHAATEGVDKELEVASNSAHRNSAVANMHKVLADIYDMQRRFNDAANKNDMEHVFGSLGQGHRALVELMTQALGNMQFYDVMRQRVDHVQGAIHELNTHLQQLATLMQTPDGSLSDGERLQDLLAAQTDRYVMHSQINTHNMSVGGSASVPVAAAVPSIELF